MTEWREATLGDYLRVRHGFAFKGEYFRDDGDLVVLTPGNFHDGGGFKEKSGKEKYYDGPIPDGYLLAKGDVVVAMTEQSHGLLGSTATVPHDGRYLHNQRLGLLHVADPSRLDLRFCYHLMNGPTAREQIQATATGSKVRHTAPERIEALRVRMPSLDTQRVVARVLDSIDDLIENNRRRIEVLEQMAQAIYREWFVRFRFPGHEDATFVDSALGPIPEGWQVKPLGEIASVNRDSRKPDAGERIRYLDISGVGVRAVGAIAEMDGADAPGRARRVVGPGDVVWSMVRPNRRAHAQLVSPGADWVASTGLAVLTPSSVSPAFLFETVSAGEFTAYLVCQESGAAYPAVKPRDFDTAPVVVPDPATDVRFSSAVEPHHRLVWSLRGQSAGLVAVRDLLLHPLVTGQIDVSQLDLDAVMEAAG